MIPWREQLAMLGRGILWLIWGPKWMPVWAKIISLIVTPVVVIGFMRQLYWAVALAGFICIATGWVVSNHLEP